MRLRVRPMRPDDVNSAAQLNASHPEQRRRYGDVLAQLPAAWLKQLRAGSLITAILEDTGGAPRVVGCGAPVFVTDGFLRQLKTAPFIWIGPELLRRSLSRFRVFRRL